MEYYISVGLIALASVLACFTGLPMLKTVQLSGYRTRGVIAWCKGTAYDIIIRYAALLVFGFITVMIYVASFIRYEYARYCAVALFVLLEIVFIASNGKHKSNDIKLTPRAVRLIIADGVLSIGCGALIAWATYASVYCQTLIALFGVLSPLLAVVANITVAPFERLHNKKFTVKAKRKLAEKKPVVVGITGSYGKTTAKNMLRAMLEKKYTVLATPGSYNTPMGVCKTVNNTLGNEQIFIAELGARYKGDIKELCDIVLPGYGLITAVGDMHIETLGSRAGVADVKFELAEAIPEGGLVIVNGYDAAAKALCERKTRCGMQCVEDGAEASYENLNIGRDGTCFELVLDGERYSVRSKLLGAHIAELATLCAALAYKMGVNGEDIAAALNSMAQVEHRLSLVPSPDPSVTVIDDAYNSNPVGAKNALSVLARFDGAKIIITPGFAELGSLRKQCNTELGESIAAVCDYAFLIGSGAGDIKKGAVRSGMSEEKITVCTSRDDAVQRLKNISGEKTVLFENDFPDNIK